MPIASGARTIEMNCEVENMPTVPALVAAEELDDEARHGVEQHVEPERPARERLALAFRRRAAAIRISSSAPASYSCVGCSGTPSGVPTLAAANGSVNVMPHGSVVGLP